METKNIKRNGILGKGLVVLLITCALEIPVLLLGGLIDERRELSTEVKEELATSWGGTLEIDVPQLCAPFFMNSTDKDGKTVKELKLRKAKSSATEVDATVNVEVLHRSIYDIPVYKADVIIKGVFKTNDTFIDNINGDIYVNLPLNKYRGLEGYPCIVIDNKEYFFTVSNGNLRAKIPSYIVKPNSSIEYSLQFKSKGMDSLNFTPSGTDFCVTMKSNYPSPSFKGDFLPSSRNVSDEGFDSKWEITALNSCNVPYAEFGVDFLVTADQYQQTERALKYAFLFFILVLSSIFLVESITKSRINVVQYVVTGLSLCLFYLLLLSISEYLSFGWSYLIASIMTTGSLGGYFYGFLKSKVAIAFTVATGVLYGFIYMLLQMESGALLIGSLALFVILGVIMYFTRSQDMFESQESPKEE